jgi:hypothetical protein
MSLIKQLNSYNPIVRRRDEFVEWILTNKHYQVKSVLGQDLDRFNVNYDNYNTWETYTSDLVHKWTKLWMLTNFTFYVEPVKVDEYSPSDKNEYNLMISFDTVHYKMIQTGAKEKCDKTIMCIKEAPQMYYFED